MTREGISNRSRRILSLGCLALLACLVTLIAVPQPAEARREIRLGGNDDSKAPPNVVPLPPIVVAIRKADGGWHHVRIDAWLAPQDVRLVRKMDNIKNAIAQKVVAELPAHPFEDLQTPEGGERITKDVIHTAAEHSIGKPWTGDVLIQTLLIY